MSQHNSSTNNKKYVRFLIRGKKARGVPVLLTHLMSKAMHLILKYRDDAGVSKNNPYLFGIPGNST